MWIVDIDTVYVWVCEDSEHWRQSTEAATGGLLFLKISQNSQENTCDGISFSIKLQAGVFMLVLQFF